MTRTKICCSKSRIRYETGADTAIYCVMRYVSVTDLNLPEEFQADWALAYYDERRKFHEPTKRRARRHFDEDVCWFTDRYEAWLGCRGSNHDAAALSDEDREVALVLHRGMVWLRHTYSSLLAKRMKEGNSYVPHDYRGKLAAMRSFLIDKHNAGEVTFTTAWATKNGIKRHEVSRDFKADDCPENSPTIK